MNRYIDRYRDCLNCAKARDKKYEILEEDKGNEYTCSEFAKFLESCYQDCRNNYITEIKKAIRQELREIIREERVDAVFTYLEELKHHYLNHIDIGNTLTSFLKTEETREIPTYDIVDKFPMCIDEDKCCGYKEIKI